MQQFKYTLLRVIAFIVVIFGSLFCLVALAGYFDSGDIKTPAIILAMSSLVILSGVLLIKYAAKFKVELPDSYLAGNKYEGKYPEKWAEIFVLIEKSGGVKMPHLKELSKSERLKVRMNWFAFFFGPIYYLVLGMWRPVITYIFAMVILYEGIDRVALTYFGKENVHISGVAAGIIWGMFANVNYYKLKVLGEKNWF